jgi:hypothetical protein
MTLSKLSRTLIGAALTVMLGSFALAPAVAVTGPTITWVNDITDGSTYAYGQVPTVAPTCSAVDEALAAVDCTVSGYDATVGVHVLTAAATANEVTTTETHTYTVTAWTLKGFFRPVKMGTGVWNKVKGGSVVPLKFKVFTDAALATKLKSTAAVTGFTSQLVSCTDGSATSAPVALSTTKKGFALKYRDGAFQKNWKTSKATKITTVVTKVTHKGKKIIVKKIKTTVPACYVVSVATADGSALTAFFRLR